MVILLNFDDDGHGYIVMASVKFNRLFWSMALGGKFASERTNPTPILL